MRLRRESGSGLAGGQVHVFRTVDSPSPSPSPSPPPTLTHPPPVPHDPIRLRLSSVGDCGDSSGASGVCSAVSSVVSGSSSGGSSGASSGASSAGSDDYMSAAQLQACRRNLEESPDTDVASLVTEEECQQVEIAFRSLKTDVFVCPSLCNLYTCSSSAPDNWQLRFTGVPVVLLDTGETRARSKRQITLLLSERGSCFTLWKDTIDNLSSYEVISPSFHTMHLSSDHSSLIGLSFDCSQAAAALWDHMERLTACPENISLSGPRLRRTKKTLPRKSHPAAPAPSKAQISHPCCFQHVISVDRLDRDRYFSLQTLVPALREVEESREERKA